MSYSFLGLVQDPIVVDRVVQSSSITASGDNVLRDAVAAITTTWLSLKSRHQLNMAAGSYAEIQIKHANLDYIDIVGAGIGQTLIVSDGLRADIDPVSGLAYSAMAFDDKHGFWGGYKLNMSGLTWTVNDVKYCNHASSFAANKSSRMTSCRFVHSNGYPIGSNLTAANVSLLFVSCEFVKSGANVANGTLGSHGIYCTNGNATAGPVYLSATNCEFENCGVFRLSELGSGQTDPFTATNCSTDDSGTAKGIYITASGSGLSYSIEITQNGGTMPAFAFDAVNRPDAEDYYTYNP
jgi:hypothetical protein